MRLASRRHLYAHLEELRRRIITCVVFVVFAAFSCFYFAPSLLSLLVRPAPKVVFIFPAELFAVNVLLSLWAALIVSAPVIIYHAWQFIACGLKLKEKKSVISITIISCLLFIIGSALGYFIITPLGLKFLLSFSTPEITPMLSVKSYVTFVAGLTLVFGLVFQLPLIMVFLSQLGIVDYRLLSCRRREAVVLIFVIAAFFTPPDVVTQILLAIPLLCLYELSVLFVKIVYNKKKREGAKNAKRKA